MTDDSNHGLSHPIQRTRENLTAGGSPMTDAGWGISHRRRAKSRTTRSPLLLFFVVLFLVSSFLQTCLAAEGAACEDGTATTENGECPNPMANKNDSNSDNEEAGNQNNAATASEAGSPPIIRMITHEELAQHTGEKDSTIWLSILGEVYDVSAGPDYYAKGKGSYGAFSGIDCTLCFVSGTFTKEEGDKPPSEIPSEQLPALLDWRNFYADHATYKFVGYLLDERYYNEHGKPTATMLELRDRVKVAMEAAAIKKAEREKKRAELKRKRVEEQKNKEKQEAEAAKQ